MIFLGFKFAHKRTKFCADVFGVLLLLRHCIMNVNEIFRCTCDRLLLNEVSLASVFECT